MNTNRDNNRARACGAKIRYSGPAVAANAVTALGWAGRHGLEAYECTFCGSWHIGRNNRAKAEP